jgi:hypothetical protein
MINLWHGRSFEGSRLDKGVNDVGLVESHFLSTTRRTCAHATPLIDLVSATLTARAVTVLPKTHFRQSRQTPRLLHPLVGNSARSGRAWDNQVVRHLELITHYLF